MLNATPGKLYGLISSAIINPIIIAIIIIFPDLLSHHRQGRRVKS